MYQCHVSASSPCSTRRANCVRIPSHPPIGRVFVRHKCPAETEAVLRRHAACSDVQRMISKQRIGTAGQELQTKTVTCLANVFSLAAKIRLQSALLCSGRSSHHE